VKSTAIDLMASVESAAEWRARQKTLPTITLDNRSLGHLEMLAVGGFSPLKGFMGKADYQSVIERMRLADGQVWTIPITLSVSREAVSRFKEGESIGLLEGAKLLAILHLKEKYVAERSREAEHVYGTQESAHPGVATLKTRGEILLGGDLEVLELPSHTDFSAYRMTPGQTRKAIADRGWKKVVGFQTRNPIHRAHE
jgi:sulfate adenylyltransferase